MLGRLGLARARLARDDQALVAAAVDRLAVCTLDERIDVRRRLEHRDMLEGFHGGLAKEGWDDLIRVDRKQH